MVWEKRKQNTEAPTEEKKNPIKILLTPLSPVVDKQCKFVSSAEKQRRQMGQKKARERKRGESLSPEHSQIFEEEDEDKKEVCPP